MYKMPQDASKEVFKKIPNSFYLIDCKAVLYQDTVSVEPGSRPFLDSVSVSKDTFMDVGRCRGWKRYILLILMILFVCPHMGLENVSKGTLLCVEHNLV